ncbi:MAG: hypothetical protein Alpg2KO_00820 [Alphaproteobacteria bacterium]
MPTEFKTESASVTGGAAAATIYTTPSAKNTVFHKLRITNTDNTVTTTVTITINGTLTLNSKDLTPGETWVPGQESGGGGTDRLGLSATDTVEIESYTTDGDLDVVWWRQTMDA